MHLSRALFLLPLLLNLLPYAQAADDAGDWIVTGHETCTGRRVVDHNITVRAGAVLELRGCALVMDSPPYVDQFFAQRDEGLSLTVEAGGLLRMVALPGQGASIERADPRYGYTVKVFGDVESTGLPDAPNVVRGLEGAHQDRLGLGGFQVRGNATLRHMRFEDNLGPSVFVLGGSLSGDHLAFVNGSGIMALSARSVRLADVNIDAVYAAMSVSLTPSVDIQRCRMHALFVGFFAAMSNVTLRDCSISSDLIALVGENTAWWLADSEVDYGRVGISQGFRAKGKVEHANSVDLDNVTITGNGPNATSALAGAQVELELRGSRLSGGGPTVNATGLRLIAEGNQVSGSPPMRLVDPVALHVQANTWGSEPAVRMYRQTLVIVQDRDGRPLADVEVELPGAVATTNAAGQALLTWHWMDATEVARLDANATVTLRILDPQTGTSVVREMEVDFVKTIVTLGARERGLASPAWPTLVLALAALVLLRRR